MTKYITAFGDRIPDRDNMDDWCEFDYSQRTFDIAQEVVKANAKHLRTLLEQYELARTARNRD